MAKQIGSSWRIAHPSGKSSGRDRPKEIELHVARQKRIAQADDIARRLAAASQPLGELGKQMERMQRAVARSGVLADFDKRLAAIAHGQKRIAQADDIARRLAAASQPLGELGKQMERMQRAVARSGALADFDKRLAAIADRQMRIAQAGGIAVRRAGAASQLLGELVGRVECLPPGLSVPPVPRLPEVPRMDPAWQLRFLPPGQPLRPVAAQSEPTKPCGNSQRSVSLELTLAAFEPAFADQFRGAWLRSEERGPDWLTQAAASIRKLLLSLLHAAAPDECVLPWVQHRKAQLDRNGRPTRRTKIEWLCRSIRNTGYRKFVKSELNSALEVLELCNQAVHVDEFPDFEESFNSVFARVEFAVHHIVRLSGRRRST